VTPAFKSVSFASVGSLRGFTGIVAIVETTFEKFAGRWTLQTAWGK